jgi:5'-nucleotidase/UDP-sugar diphosphatase
MDLEFEQRGKLKFYHMVSYRLIPVNLTQEVAGVRSLIEAQIAEDSEMLQLLTPFHDNASERLNVVVARATGLFDGERAVVRGRECELGNLFTRAMLEKTGAQVAIMNGGGIRASLPEGDVTIGNILAAHPFGDLLAVVQVPGSVLRQILDMALAKEPGSGGFAHVAGIRAVRDTSTGRFTISVGDELLDDSKTYSLATRNFNAAGGDGYPNLLSYPTYSNTGYTLVDAILEAIARRGNVLRLEDFPITGAIQR